MDNINEDKLLSNLKTHLGLDEQQPTPKPSPAQTLQSKGLNSSPFQTDYYKQAMKRLDELKQYCQRQMDNKASRSDILADIQKSARVIMDDYHKGVKAQIKDLQAWQKDYINAYKSKEENYDNPELELLHRQDWNSKLEAMSDHDLSEFVDNLGDEKLSAYELNTLLKKTKGNTELRAKVELYGDTNHIGHEWEATEPWYQVNHSLSLLRVYENSPLLYEKPVNNQNTSFNAINVEDEVTSLLNASKDDHQYTVDHHEPVNIFADND